MAINLDDRYPGRAGGKTLSYPQGSFKNRTSPTSKDGTYLEQDWANDWAAFFQSLMSDAGLTANGTVDTAQASQYFDALMSIVNGKVDGLVPAMTFSQVDALASDQGPIIVTDMGGYLYKWTTSAYFTGYRNVRCGNMPETFAASPRAWELAVTGGVWSMSDPKQKRLIAWFQEQGLVVPSANWIPGQGMISDLGSGNWKACDLQNMFLRKAGTDADTANATTPGTYKGDTVQGHWHSTYANATDRQFNNVVASPGNWPQAGPNNVRNTGGEYVKEAISDGVHGSPRVGMETAPQHTLVAPIILI